MTSTLLTIIGKGDASADPASDPYQRTAYAFPGGARTSVFFGAALVQELRPQQVILVGTRTSSWRALAIDEANDLDLAAQLEAEEHNGVTPTSLARLADVLGLAWHTTVSATALPVSAAPDEAGAATVALAFYRLLPRQGPFDLDLTHGFRTLPMLAMAAVNLYDAFHPGLLARTTLWYGELARPAASGPRPARPGGSLADGRALRLDGLRQTARLARAAAALTTGFDPGPLADLVRPASPQLADVLDDLGDALLTHDFVRLTRTPEQILARLDRLEGDLDGLVADEVRAVLQPLATGGLGRRLIALAGWASDHGRHALAAIAAHEGLVRLATRDASTREADRVVEAYLAGKPAEAAVCDRLRRARNRVAHGAETVSRDPVPVDATVRAALPVLRRLAKDDPTQGGGSHA